MAKLLVIDDEQTICWGLSQLGQSLGHEVETASSAEQGLELARQITPDVVLLDVRLPGIDGLEAMGLLREHIGQTPIVVMTAYGDLKTAVNAVSGGAFEYLVKPFDLDLAQQVIVRALDSAAAAAQPETLEVPGNGENGEDPAMATRLIGTTPQMQEVFKRIALGAPSDAPVLLAGESGVGKELAARAIHRYSPRSEGPFVAVNVASLSPSLAESELFGHVRGAFTGAETERTGLMVQANDGVLFLDEVADIPLPTQVKLLRAIEHGEVLPVGGNQPIKTNFRLISATHQSLLELVQQGTFRHDLYFRLCAFRIEIPPLRQRPDDIQALAEHFLRLATLAREGTRFSLSEEAIDQLRQRPWYGNVRELRNAIDHAVILSRGGAILPEHLPPVVQSPTGIGPEDPTAATDNEQIQALIHLWSKGILQDSDSLGIIHERLLELVEPPLIRAAIEKHRQCAAAARDLGIHRTTLKKKMDHYGIEDDE